ncbi:unnamed protein product, partial [Prunus brigantina]
MLPNVTFLSLAHMLLPIKRTLRLILLLKVGNGSLIDGLYCLNLSSNNVVFTTETIGQKRSLDNEKSAKLWHKRLGHTLEGHRYFITFIDDFSRFCYLYLIQTKSSAFEVFKIFKTEVENQLELKIKVLRSDRGGEYYGKYDEQGRHPSPLARYLQDCGIVAQYTNPGTPQENGVSKRRNRT